MVTLAELDEWKSWQLGVVASGLNRNRTQLIATEDELDAALPPASWQGEDAKAARQAHREMEARLDQQVAELTQVIAAVRTAQEGISAAQETMRGAMSLAQEYELSVDLTTGAVQSVGTYTLAQQKEKQLAQAKVNEVIAQLEDALRAANEADKGLANAMTAAASGDRADAMDIDLIQQFQQMSDQEAANYLMDNPHFADGLLPYARLSVRGLIAEAIAADLDRDLSPDDTDELDHVNLMMETFGDDETIMAALYKQLGPDGLMEAMTSLDWHDGAEPSEQAQQLAMSLRDGLATASRSERFDGQSYGRDLVREAVPYPYNAQVDAEYQLPGIGGSNYTGDELAALDFLLSGEGYGERFVRGATWELDDFERTMPNRAAEIRREATDSWYSRLGRGENEPIQSPDPMAKLLGHMGDYPDAVMDFLTDPVDPDGQGGAASLGQQRQDYHFRERDWRADGFAGVSQMMAGLAENHYLVDAGGERVSEVMSNYFEKMAQNDDFNARNASAASESIGRIVAQYTPSFYDAHRNNLGGAGHTLDMVDMPYFPDIYDLPSLDQASGSAFIEVGTATEQGMARMAEGFGAFRQARLEAYALEPDEGGLQNILNDAAALDGWIIKESGDTRIEQAQEADDRVALWSSMVSDAVGLLPVPGADFMAEGIAKDVADLLWGKAEEIPGSKLEEIVGNHVERTNAELNQEGRTGANQSLMSNYLALVEAGIIEISEEDPNNWRIDGTYGPSRMITLDEIMRSADANNYYRNAENRIASLAPDDVDVQSIYDSYRSAFERDYRD